MSVFLVGGGWSDEHAPEVFGGFLAAARERAGGATPRVLLVVMGTGVRSRRYHRRYRSALRLAGKHRLRVVRVAAGGTVDPAELDGVHGLFVGGGLTSDYHAALAPAYDAIRRLVADGLPYAGFSAGAVIAASHAILGGWRVDGVPICPEDSNEELDELTVVEGIGLVEGAVDAHAVQWGNLSRLIAAVDAGHAPHGVAIDENTVLALPAGSVAGAGRVWRVSADLHVTRS